MGAARKERRNKKKERSETPHSASDIPLEKTKMYITLQEEQCLREIAAVHQEWLLLAVLGHGTEGST